MNKTKTKSNSSIRISHIYSEEETLVIVMASGARVIIPFELLNITEKSLVNVHEKGRHLLVDNRKLSLQYLSRMIMGRVTPQEALSVLGAIGGSVRCPKKVRAARTNGKKGSRPKKTQTQSKTSSTNATNT